MGPPGCTQPDNYEQAYGFHGWACANFISYFTHFLMLEAQCILSANALNLPALPPNTPVLEHRRQIGTLMSVHTVVVANLQLFIWCDHRAVINTFVRLRYKIFSNLCISVLFLIMNRPLAN